MQGVIQGRRRIEEEASFDFGGAFPFVGLAFLWARLFCR
jgi:hypothetical protein